MALSLWPKVKLQVPPLRFRSGRDDKFKGGGPPWHWWRWRDRTSTTANQPGFGLAALSSTHSANCAVQKAVPPLSWTALLDNTTLLFASCILYFSGHCCYGLTVTSCRYPASRLMIEQPAACCSGNRKPGIPEGWCVCVRAQSLR